MKPKPKQLLAQEQGDIGGACYGFADTFGGTVEEPRVLRSDGWRLVQTERSGFSGKAKHKPGHIATQRGAALLVDTVTPGVALQAGFLRTHASRAVARLSCVARCRCANELHAHTNASTDWWGQSVVEVGYVTDLPTDRAGPRERTKRKSWFRAKVKSHPTQQIYLTQPHRNS